VLPCLTLYSVTFFANDARRDLSGLDGHRLIYNPLLLGVVTHFNVTGQREILAERVTDEAVLGKDAAQVWMPFEYYAETVKRLTLEPVHARPHIYQSRQDGEVIVRYPGADTQAPIVGNRDQVQHHRVPARELGQGPAKCRLAPRGVVDRTQIDAGSKVKRRLIAQRSAGVNPLIGTDFERKFVQRFGQGRVLAELRQQIGFKSFKP